jgi:hypothetical protein
VGAPGGVGSIAVVFAVTYLTLRSAHGCSGSSAFSGRAVAQRVWGSLAGIALQSIAENGVALLRLAGLMLPVAV